MAGPNDYSLDPYQVEEDNLAEQYKRALLKTLRPTPSMSDFSARFNTAADKASGEQEMMDTQAQRSALSQKMMAALPDALRGGTASMLTHPLLRGIAQKRLQDEQDMELDALDRARRAAARNSMGPPAPGTALPGATGAEEDTGLKEALDDMYSIRPRIAKFGHDRAQLAMPRGNSATVALNLNKGTFGVVPAGVQSAQQVDYAKAMNEQTDWWNPATNRYEKRPRWFVEQQQGIGAPPGMNQPGMPASSPRALPSATGTAPTPPMPVSGPNMPVSGGSPSVGGAPAAPYPMQVTPEVQLQRDMIRLSSLQQELQKSTDPREAQAIQQEIASTIKTIESNPANPTANQGAVKPASYTPPAATDRGQFSVPQPGPGTANPQQTQMSQAAAEAEYKARLKFEESSQMVYTGMNTLEQLERLNKKPLYSGKASNFVGTLGAETGMLFNQQPSQKWDDTQEYAAHVNKFVAPLATALGYNPSNFDAQIALKQIANLDLSPRGRAQVLAAMRRALEYDMGTRETIRQLMDSGKSLTEAQEIADGRYRRALAQKEAETRNPTQADGKGKALPSATAATEPGFWSKAASNFPKALGDSEQVARDMWGNLATLATGPFRSSHWAAGKDTAANLWEGIQQRTGSGDPLAYEAERARQDERMRTDPGYAVSRGMTDITMDPLNIAPGGGVLKSAALAGLQGFLKPTGTEGGSGENAVFNAAFTLPFSVAAKVLPATKLAKDINAEGRGQYLLDKFKAFKPVDAQVNPEGFGATVSRTLGTDKAAAKDQVAQITASTVRKAGMSGEVYPEKFVANEERLGKIWDSVLPKGRVIKATPQDQAALADAIAKTSAVEDVTGKSPALARLYELVKPKTAPVVAATTAEAAQKSSGNVVPGETAEEWAKRTGWKAPTKAQYAAAAEARTPVELTPGRHVGPLEKEAIQANQNHLDALRAEVDAEQQLMQHMIRDEFGHRGPIQRWRGTPEQEAKLKAALDNMDRSFSQETAKISRAAEEAARAEIAANKAAADKAAQEYAGKANLGPSDAPPHPVGKSKGKDKEPKTFVFDAANLHQAWKDLTKIEGNSEAVQEVRNLITGMIERHLGRDALNKFREANNQWGVTQDLKRIYSGGYGEGSGASAGKISAEAFRKTAGEHPLSKDTDEAAQLIHRFQVRDPVADTLQRESMWGTGRDALQKFAGGAAYKAEKFGQKVIGDVRSSEGRKRMIELLRAAMERGYQTTQSGSK